MNDIAMSPPPLVRRVEILEENVGALSQLPARVAAVETQLVAMRGDINSLRAEMSTMRDEMSTMRDDLRTEIRAGDEETRRHMGVLHEDVISRIALLQEGIDRRNGDSRPSAGKRSPSKRRR